MIKKSLIFGMFLFLSMLTIAQTQISVCPMQTTFSSMSRGYHFTAPCNFTICGLYVPADASTGLQSVEVVRFTAGAPPAYSGTTNSFTSLFYQSYWPTNAMIPCNITVNAGDLIGVYGCRGTNSTNSYGQAACPTTIMGNAVTLYRSGMQYNLATQQMHDIWSEVTYYTGRIYMYINCCPTADFTVTTPICLGDTSTITYTGSGVPPTASFNWTFTGGTPATANTIGPHDVTWATAGVKTVTLDVSQTACATVSETHTVTINAGPTVIAAGLPTSICAGQSSTLSASGATSYTWDNGMTGSSINVSPTSTTTYTVSGTGASGCTGIDSITVTVNPLPIIIVADQSICGGETATLSASGANTYNWSNGSTGSSINVSPSSTSTYTVSGTDVNSCENTASATVTVNPSPVINIVTTPDYCDSGNGTAVASGSGATAPYQYNWNTSPAQNTDIADSLPAGTYTVTVSDDNACSNAASATVGTQAGFSLSSSSEAEHCDQMDGSAQVTVSNAVYPLTYSWSHNAGLNSTDATTLSSGTYTVTVSDGQCTRIEDILVEAMDGPTAGFLLNPTVVLLENPEVNIVDESIGAITWFYDFGDGYTSTLSNTIHSFNGIGEYLVMQVVTDNFGCSDTAWQTLIVNENFTFFIPNAFSPNGDGKNDYFHPYGVGIDANTWSMRIYDRWGHTVFYTTDINQSWDGDYDGDVDETSQGVYSYYITFKTISGILKKFQGRVTKLP
ncbi:MAG: gliding motility-associated C-terminal domain-containing protein [Flavobacteriales bacterium]|nr:gliding motility-associated C-terminal domain-containing protein [Flavobacteriales bacterium]